MQFNLPFLGTKIAIGETTSGQKPRSRRTNDVAFESDTAQRLKIDKEDLYSIWRQNVDVYSCVRKIRQTSCIGGVFYYDPKDDARERPAAPTAKKRVIDVLSYYYGDPRKFKNELLKHQLISGDTYIEKVYDRAGQPLGAKVLDSRTISVVQDVHGTVLAYIQGVAEFVSGDSEDVVVFDPSEIIHWKIEIDPDNEAFGFSPLEAALSEARTDVEAAESNLAFFKNHSVPPAHFILDPELTDEDEKKVVETLRKFFKGSKNRGRSLAMKGLKEIKSIKLTHEEMQFLEGRMFATKKVASAYGVPSVLLGHTEGVNYSNHEGQMQDFYDTTVIDYDLSYSQLMNVDIIGDFLNMSEQVQMLVKPPIFEARSAVWERAMKARELGLVTINGARAMVGDDPIDPDVHGDMGDLIVLGNGSSAVLLTDLGVDPSEGQSQLDSVKKILKAAAARNNGDDEE
jgi:HK97 family phage portal protein